MQSYHWRVPLCLAQQHGRTRASHTIDLVVLQYRVYEVVSQWLSSCRVRRNAAVAILGGMGETNKLSVGPLSVPSASIRHVKLREPLGSSPRNMKTKTKTGRVCAWISRGPDDGRRGQGDKKKESDRHGTTSGIISGCLEQYHRRNGSALITRKQPSELIFSNGCRLRYVCVCQYFSRFFARKTD